MMKLRGRRQLGQLQERDRRPVQDRQMKYCARRIVKHVIFLKNDPDVAVGRRE